MPTRPRQDALSLLLQQVSESDVLTGLGAGLRVALLRAEPHPGLPLLARHAALAHLEMQSTFKPFYDALAAAGLNTVMCLEGTYDLILFVPTKQRRESLACMAEAMAHLSPRGRLLVSCANESGAVSYEKSLRALAGQLGSFSKAHCRVFWAARETGFDAALAAQWRQAVLPGSIPGTRFESVPGIYGWNKIDQGSALLADHLPQDLKGRGMNLGCNYGYLGASLLRKNPGVDTLYLVDAEARALDCARRNLAGFPGVTLDYRWADVNEALPRDLDFVVLNPPFHAGKETDYTLGRRFVEQACASLRPGGRLFLVANQFLSYENTLETRLHSFARVAQAQGFKILTGRK